MLTHTNTHTHERTHYLSYILTKKKANNDASDIPFIRLQIVYYPIIMYSLYCSKVLYPADLNNVITREVRI